MFVYDLAKIKYIAAGYLPNYPYHMISCDELCDAFMRIDGDSKTGYFYDMYPCLDPTLVDAYGDLESAIYAEVSKLRSIGYEYIIPDWVASYMLGYTISIHSDPADIYDLLGQLGLDNTESIFAGNASLLCFNASVEWLTRTTNYGTSGASDTLRPPTMFGEPHVSKYLRLKNLYPLGV